MDDVTRVLKDTLYKRKSEYLEHLRAAVSIDTRVLGHGIKGGREKEGQEYLKKLLTDMGADELIEDEMKEEVITAALKKHGEGNPGHDYSGRYNVYASFGGKKGRKSLMFNGHIDTMPPGDESLWKYPPHTPTEEDGRLYGLGSADMKGGLMASILAVKLFKDAGLELPTDVKIVSVCDEEGGGNGSIQAAMNGQKADYVVVCEPTGDKLITAHMGFVFFKVCIRGKANHSGEKWAGVSAIDKAIKLINGLNELEHGWLLKYKHPLLPAPNLNVGTIHGGSAGSTVAGECFFETCIHYLPGQMDYRKVYDEFTSLIDRISDSDLWLREHRPVITMYQSGGAFEQDINSGLVNCMKKAVKRNLDRELEVTGSPAGCDSRIWKNIAGSEVVQYGPGNLEQCHAVNEYLEIEKFYEAILVYAGLIQAVCEEEEA